jgi:hypothetical protein
MLAHLTKIKPNSMGRKLKCIAKGKKEKKTRFEID